MIGLLVTPIKVQLGPLTNGLVIMESFVPAPTFNFPGLDDCSSANIAHKAAGQKIDPFGYGFVPFGYAAGQILAQAVTETKSLDHDKLAEYIHSQQVPDRGRRNLLRQGRRMGRSRARSSPSSRTWQPNDVDQFRDGAEAADPVAGGVQDRRR